MANLDNYLNEFHPIPGFEGFYKINRLGEVASESREARKNYYLKGRVLKQSLCGKYKAVSICIKLKARMYLVHRLVALTFIPNPENKPCVNHIDFNTQNNHADNLEWCTYSENMLHSIKHGRIKKMWLDCNNNVISKKYILKSLRTRGQSRRVKQLSLDGNLIKIHKSIKSAIDETGVPRMSIYGQLRKFGKRVKYFKWEYV